MNSKLIPVAVINPDAPVGCLEAKQPDIDNGTAVHDKSGYFTEDYMALEWDRLWSRSWLIAGVTADIPELGDYFLFRIRHESFIISRTPEGVRAFYNVCPHRGARLVTEERGNRKVFVCPFHSWSFSNGGALRSITDESTFKPEVVEHRPGLTQARCEVHGGLIFINMDAAAAPLADEIGLPEGYLENYQIDRMRVVRHVRSEWGSNWKVGVEAFYESYHLHAVHPETRGVMADLNVQYDLYPRGASRMIVPLG
ncbi:MAG: aromatic ring-hydroxylating dioxygenase subunit alpha, partial [Cellvibrionales bacterium]